MKEHEPPEAEPYWQEDLAIGEGRFSGELSTIRLQLHTAEERRASHQEIVPIPHKPGQRIARTYVHARPYILVPEITLTIGTFAEPTEAGAIGKVLSLEWEGMRHELIGNCQAWYYPQARTAVLWEAFLEDRYRQENPLEDEGLVALWTGFERVLLERFSGVERMATPSWETLYERELWQGFLQARGYAPFNEQAFVKEIQGQGR